MTDHRPVLWQYTFSNYNEKVRWTLDFKRIPHRRRSLLPGSPRALAFSRGTGTIPVLDLDGERIVDSTRIIETLERRFEERPLYPGDEAARSRALELEDYFDEHAGHDLRRVAFWDLRDVPGYLAAFTATGFGGVARAWMRASGSVAWAYASRRYGFNEADVDRSRRQVIVALDRLVDELRGRDHLVGSDFTVADLTAASLMYPLAWPDELQYSPPAPPRWEFAKSLADHPAVGWIRDTYRRYRGVSAEA
jgi:glutathione S-transferase